MTWLTLDEVLEDIIDRRGLTPLKLGGVFADAGFRVISAKLVKGNRIDLTADEPRYVTERVYRKWMRSPLLRGDVLLTSEAPLGEVAYVGEPRDWCIGQRLFALRPNPKVVDGRYLFFALQMSGVRDDLHSRSTGTTVLGIRQTELRRVRLPIPSLSAQHGIADVLGALDDKIELNRRMNETLEQTARALFKSWFVDFDPVRAKAEGRQSSGMDAETAALFPSEFDREADAPRGWVRAPLSHWCEALSGGTPSKSQTRYWNGGIPWISPKVMTSLHADEAEAFVTKAAIGNGTRIAPTGSTLVMVRGMGLHEEVRVSQPRTAVTFNQDVKALVPTRISASLLLFALVNAKQDLLGRVESSGHGTGRLPSDVLLATSIAMPPIDLQMKLAQTFDAINDAFANARQQRRTLATLRDALLPKLLSGEIRVRDAERIASGVST